MSEQRRTAAQAIADDVSRRSPRIVWFFARVFERALHREFNSIRAANLPAAPVLGAPSLVIYSNHCSWWDAALFLFVAERVLGNRPAYTPMDAQMMGRYGFFKRIGAFGIERSRAAGARRFLEGSRIVLAQPGNLLFVTAQGRFADCRERPLKLEPGIAHLVTLAPSVVYVPLAVEYTFWLEKRPELLLRFGSPMTAADMADGSSVARLEVLEKNLTDTMDQLATDAIGRNASAFHVLLRSRGGINPFYDLWRRAVALIGRRPYRAQHGPGP